ncbi:MAG: hypothetical protein QG552_3473 [Thermodesulfobacteriota bacterium]|nr:hypothetical protein [Thermodesulfobacteriota bacterium]
MKRKHMVLIGCGCLAITALGCAAGPQGPYSTEAPAGFFAGIWHGFIAWITFVVSLFSQVKMYSVDNTGAGYNLGFLIGMACWLGGWGGSWKYSRKTPDEREWDDVAEKVEAKLKRELKNWAETEDSDEWDEVEKKVEQKIRKVIRDWAEK